MAWDDSLPWTNNKQESKPQEKEQTKQPYKLKWASEVLSKVEKEKRAPRPSPLLEQYMKELGLHVK